MTDNSSGSPETKEADSPDLDRSPGDDALRGSECRSEVRDLTRNELLPASNDITSPDSTKTGISELTTASTVAFSQSLLSPAISTKKVFFSTPDSDDSKDSGTKLKKTAKTSKAAKLGGLKTNYKDDFRKRIEHDDSDDDDITIATLFSIKNATEDTGIQTGKPKNDSDYDTDPDDDETILSVVQKAKAKLALNNLNTKPNDNDETADDEEEEDKSVQTIVTVTLNKKIVDDDSSFDCRRGHKKIISSNYFPTDLALSYQDARDVLVFENKPKTHDHVNLKYRQIKKRLRHLHEMVRISNEQLMYEEALSQGITYGDKKQPKPIKSFKDLKTSIKDDGSPDNMTKMFHVVQGQYDRDKSLGKKFKDAYFERYNLGYPEGYKGKGCIEKMFYRGRRELKRKLNNCSEKSHGWKINITRKHDDINVKNQFFKRPMGSFDCGYIKHNDTLVSVLFE
jgi:hypothetical protein